MGPRESETEREGGRERERENCCSHYLGFASLKCNRCHTRRELFAVIGQRSEVE